MPPPGLILIRRKHSMDFKLSKDPEMIRKLFREFAENDVKPLDAMVDEEEMFPEHTVTKMVETGRLAV